MLKQVYKIKSAQKATIHGFHTGDFSGADRISAENDAILSDVFKRIMYSLTDYAYVSTGASAVGGSLNNTIICGRGADVVGRGAWAVASGS